MNLFDEDKRFSQGVRDRRLKPQFYGNYATEGRYVFMDKGKLASELQRRSVDTIVQGRHGSVVCIEEKIVRWPGRTYTAFSLETDSCINPGYESPGWMRYGEADLLLYGFHQPDDGLICYLMDFPLLVAWFNEHEDEYPFFTAHRSRNMSRGRVVPILDVAAALGPRMWTFDCYGAGGPEPDLFDQGVPILRQPWLGGRREGDRARPTQ